MIQRMAGLVAIASALLWLGAGPALASKEKFVRSKPHVNVGTVGQVGPDESITTTVVLAGLAHVTADGRGAGPCSGEFDVRYLAGGPSAPVLDERLGVRLTANETFEFGFAPREPTTIVYAVIARDLAGVDGDTCVLRGLVSVGAVGDGQTRRAIPLKPEDFLPR
jgi:hypothetical protein